MGLFSSLWDMLNNRTSSADDGKINLLTVAGTGQLDPETGDANFPAQVAALLDTDRFNWLPVTYPAAVPFTGSVNVGKANAVKLIRANPGRFVLCGFSQGGMVCSGIYQSILSGSLTDLDDDLLGAVVFGNPCRKEGDLYPGYDVPGHGIASASRRLATTDERWCEFSIVNDLASAINDDRTGKWLTSVFMLLWGAAPVPSLIEIARLMAQMPPAVKTEANQLLAYFGLGNGTFNPPHTQYDTYVPPILGNTKTCVELAADWISALDDSGS